MATLSKKFDSRGWTFEYDMLPKGGLVLGNVKHKGYNFAREIRAVKIWINSEANDSDYEVTSFYLGSDDFDDITSNKNDYLRYTKFNSIAPFDIYTKEDSTSPAGIQAKFKSKNKVFGDNNDADDDYLQIEQSYIFSKYGKNPAHEPGGVLSAARIFPLIKFSYGGKKKIKTIRVDYRFNFNLDIFYYLSSDEFDSKLDKDILKESLIPTLKNKRPCLAGVFRDKEEAPLSTDLESVFSAAEKPSTYEIASYGLKNGIPGEEITSQFIPGFSAPGSLQYTPSQLLIYVAEKDQTTWDNIHIWSNYKKDGEYVKKQPSSPGAFHAVHLHWRWGDLASSPDFFDRLIVKSGNKVKTGTFTKGALGQKQFKGLDVSLEIGGPLLDPKIPKQTIKFAITKLANADYDNAVDKKTTSNKWKADDNPSEEIFEDLFYDKVKKSPKPRDISVGQELLTWFSTSAKQSFFDRLAEEEFTGTTFIHGLYFAHDLEPSESTNPFAETIGSTSQKAERTWFRFPKDYL